MNNETAAPAPGPARIIIHSPAPWHEGELNGKGSIFAEDGRMRMEDSGTTLYPICRMIDTWEEVEDAGNAKIVAAAPKMYRALLAILADENACTCLAHGWHGEGHCLECIVTIAGNAIPRADAQACEQQTTEDPEADPNLREQLLETLHTYVADADCTMKSAFAYAIEDLHSLAGQMSVDWDDAMAEADLAATSELRSGK